MPGKEEIAGLLLPSLKKKRTPSPDQTRVNQRHQKITSELSGTEKKKRSDGEIEYGTMLKASNTGFVLRKREGRERLEPAFRVRKNNSAVPSVLRPSKRGKNRVAPKRIVTTKKSALCKEARKERRGPRHEKRVTHRLADEKKCRLCEERRD